MNIAEIKSLEDGADIPPFSARLAFINNRSGKVQTAKIEDETGMIKLVLINRPDVSLALKGKTLTVAGGIAQDNTYNGNTTREVKLLARGSFDPHGAVSPTPAAPAADRHAAPVNGGSNGSNGNGSKPIFGGTAGCAVKLAVDIQLELFRKGFFLDGEHFGGPAFSAAVYRLASDIVRVMQTIEEGKLAPPAKDRAELVAAEDKVVKAAKELFEEAGEGE